MYDEDVGHLGLQEYVPAADGLEVGAKLVGLCYAPTELRGDQGEMPGPSDHRVCRVGLALTDAGPWVQVDVGDDTDLAISAYLVELGVTGRVEGDATSEAGRVEVVVEGDSGDVVSGRTPEEERAGLAAVLASTFEFSHEAQEGVLREADLWSWLASYVRHQAARSVGSRASVSSP
ncbi:hypothetical protein [Kribbella kalugense]|uniref:hypothetical protein n=1 Tax=Kribbella kalugense TaxID=2512221 RepID=UPI0010649A56|nr:hypothetical protein [Kribbella kalugense]